MAHAQTRIPVAVLGATGMVGQRFIELLQSHPGLSWLAWRRQSSMGAVPMVR